MPTVDEILEMIDSGAVQPNKDMPRLLLQKVLGERDEARRQVAEMLIALQRGAPPQTEEPFVQAQQRRMLEEAHVALRRWVPDQPDLVLMIRNLIDNHAQQIDQWVKAVDGMKIQRNELVHALRAQVRDNPVVGGVARATDEAQALLDKYKDVK